MIGRKWKKVYDLLEFLRDDNSMFNISDKSLRRLTYAPNIGYGMWICSYKGLLVAIFDAGNGYWDFYTLVGFWDLIVAKIAALKERG